MESKLLEIAKKHYDGQSNFAVLTSDEDLNKFLNDFENYPHAFVLGCVMDKQNDTETTWAIPYKVKNDLGFFDIDTLAKVPLEKYKELFNHGKYHRFNNKYAKEFYDAIIKIKNDYDGDASKIWADNPSSGVVVSRFREFNGVGIKISTMAANILVRNFKIPMSDYYSIDISPDVHVIQVMKRYAGLDDDASIEQIIYKAKEINPEFPGIIDLACFEIGRKFCRPENPKCEECPLKNECDYNLNLK